MYNRLCKHIKTLLLPCLGFSAAAGFFSALLITAFKLATEWVVHLSGTIYHGVRANPAFLPLLLLGAAAIGLAASIILSYSRSCRGGGIPTSVAAIRGIVSFKWVASLTLLPISALLSFLCGLPLGTEGPCVQMGTAVGDGVVDLLGSKKHKGWRRYIMTGGAAAGFSIATSSPLAAILFSMEELHKHVSPMLLTVASLSVISARITSHALAALGLGSVRLFHLPELGALAPQKLFAPLLIGVVCGLASIPFTRLYHTIDKAMHAVLKRIPVKIAFPALFALVCAVGFLLADTLGSGHALVDTLFDTSISWYLLILIFLLRAVGMMVSNTVGATGGVFLPTLAFGAIVGSLCAQAMIAMGWMSAEHYVLMVVLGIAAFLGSTSRIPLTACVFAVEAMGGIHNILAIIVATTAALLVVEASGLEDFTDTMIGAKIRAISKGKRPSVIEVPLTVTEHAFVVGKEMRDVLWPNSCVVVAFDRAVENHEMAGIAAGDVITVRYTTYHPNATADELELLVGEQSEQVCRMMNACS